MQVADRVWNAARGHLGGRYVGPSHCSLSESPSVLYVLALRTSATFFLISMLRFQRSQFQQHQWSRRDRD